MLTPLLFAAALHADLRPDLGWMSGYWLSCEGGREVGETWTDPRLGLMLGTSLTVRDGRAGWELSRIGPLDPTPAAPPDTPLAYFAHPEGQAVTVFPVIDAGPNRVVFEQAADDDWPAIALVAVNDAVGFWSRHGFVEQPAEAMAAKLASYGADARYMLRPL